MQRVGQLTRDQREYRRKKNKPGRKRRANVNHREVRGDFWRVAKSGLARPKTESRGDWKRPDWDISVQPNYITVCIGDFIHISLKEHQSSFNLHHISSLSIVYFILSSWAFPLLVRQDIAVARLASFHLNNGLVGVLHRDLLDPRVNTLLGH